MTKEEFLAIAGQEYEIWQQSQNQGVKQDFYDCEKGIDRLVNRMGQAILQGEVGVASNDRRKKNDSHQIRQD
jgi:hypothetical protein